MNVETANRLMQYRKKAGLSQEELADKLGVSRQAVSKWECAESSPDTDNLIALAKIYNISLDELINGEDGLKKEKKDGVNIHIKDKDGSEVKVEGVGIHLKDDEGNEVNIGSGGVEIVDKGEKKDIYFKKKKNRKLLVVEDIISSVTVLGVIIAYLLLGFLANGWGQWWVLFFLITITPSIFPAIYYRKFTLFAYPMLVVMLYLALGVFFDLWHPWWVLFLTIPVYYGVLGPIDRLISRKVKIDDNVIDAHDFDEEN